ALPDRLEGIVVRMSQSRKGWCEAGGDQQWAEPAFRSPPPGDQAAEHVRKRDPRDDARVDVRNGPVITHQAEMERDGRRGATEKCNAANDNRPRRRASIARFHNQRCYSGGHRATSLLSSR